MDPKNFKFETLEDLISITEFPCTRRIKCKGFTPLMYKVIQNDVTLDDIKNSDINAKNENGWTALMIACVNSAPHPKGWGLEHLVEPLLKNGANPNIQDKKRGMTALMYVSSGYSGDHSTKKIIELLLKYGADPNIQNYEGRTASRCTPHNEIRDLISTYSKSIGVENEQLKKENEELKRKLSTYEKLDQTLKNFVFDVNEN